MEQYNVITATETLNVQCLSDGNVLIKGENIYYQLIQNYSGVLRLKIGNNYFNVYCKEISETDFELWIQHHVFRLKLEDSRSRLLSQFKKFSSSTLENVNVKAPMPGLVKAIEVNQGEIIEKGGGLIILEAMKMENEIRSTIRGRVKSVDVKLNSSVDKDQTLLTIEPIIENLNK
ncbi:MAG: acetyl-CoA carboxylase biotin carboxyl carrier protein subunit [Bacteroidota bacterium]|nr:acetyl-CoA carboxylase biotin carboxyl carrier protein subunit [Bacteroidota bacterium]